jgi:eukaryotic-like serine/threonine-protein kinase
MRSFFRSTKNSACYSLLVVVFCVSAFVLQGSAALAAGRSNSFPAASKNSASWPMLGFDPTHSGYNPNEKTLSVKNVSRLAPAWINFTYPDDSFSSSPAVVNGTVYTGTANGLVFAYNGKTGQPLWQNNIGLNNYSSPAVANGIVYVGTDTLYALNAKSGKVIWTYKTGGYIGSPIVDNGVLYFGSYDSNVYALDAATGKLLWSYNTHSPANSSPAVANGMVYIAEDASVIALNASSGTEQWTFSVGSGTPTVANGIVYISGNDNNLYALNASTGALVWKKAVSGVEYEALAVANGMLFFGTDNSIMYAFNAQTGTQIWAFTAKSLFSVSPAIANGVVYIGDFGTDLYALNANTGKMLWTYEVRGGNTSSTMVVVNGSVYVSEDYGGFYAFRLPL